MAKTPETPCIGICSTIYGDEVCRGCKRSFTEVIEWNGYDNATKQAILNRLEQTTQSIMQQYFVIQDIEKLKKALTKLNIHYRQEWSPYCWLHTLLTEAAEALPNTAIIGVQLCYEQPEQTLRQRIDEIDEMIWQQAHQQFLKSTN